MDLLSSEERDAFFKIVEALTGTCQSGSFKKDILLNNLNRRLHELFMKSFPEYLIMLADDDAEYDRFMSLITIHTTFWFREMPHFKLLIDVIESNLKLNKSMKTINIWTAACSTGLESYSIALSLESLKSRYPHLNYKIFSSDIDPVSVSFAEKGIYENSNLSSIPLEYHKYLNKLDSGFSVLPTIKSRMTFFPASVLDDEVTGLTEKMDFIFCRNILIYFDKKQIEKIIKKFSGLINPDGYLVLGHSESIQCESFGFNLKKFSSYQWSPNFKSSPQVNILDDSFHSKSTKRPELIVIGASTGGPNVLGGFMKNMPQPCPPVVIIQHINPDFAPGFARSMANSSGLNLVITDKPVELEDNCIYLVQGDYHLIVHEVDSKRMLIPNFDEPINSHRPSVDKLFSSVAETKISCVGILLTGMGRDGADGLLAMKRSGNSLTMAQNKESCVVYGMPKEAIEIGAAQIIGSDVYLSQVIRNLINKKLIKAA